MAIGPWSPGDDVRVCPHGPGASYVAVVLPAAVVFGIGIGTLVAPLTAAVLAAVSTREAGLASGINNAAARLAGLIATAVLPLAAGIGGLARLDGPEFDTGYRRAMWICAGLGSRRSSPGHPSRARSNAGLSPWPSARRDGTDWPDVIIRHHARPPIEGRRSMRPAAPQLPPVLRRAESLTGRHLITRIATSWLICRLTGRALLLGTWASVARSPHCSLRRSPACSWTDGTGIASW